MSSERAARGKDAPTTAQLAALLEEMGLRKPEAFHSGWLTPMADYLDQLMRWNRVMNLVGTRTWQDTLRYLAVDSLYLAHFLETLELPREPECWDLGAGAGLPGIVLRMIWQKGSYWLIEVREKRALFLSTFLARCPLPETRVFRGRAEAFMAGPPPRTADLVLGRAFMPWPDLLALAGPHLSRRGVAILLLREALPECPLSGWRRKAFQVYRVGADMRFFCALTREDDI